MAAFKEGWTGETIITCQYCHILILPKGIETYQITNKNNLCSYQ